MLECVGRSTDSEEASNGNTDDMNMLDVKLDLVEAWKCLHSMLTALFSRGYALEVVTMRLCARANLGRVGSSQPCHNLVQGKDKSKRPVADPCIRNWRSAHERSG